MVSGHRPRVVLIGPPGAGKSTVGEAVAERLGVDLHDTDAAIEAAQARTITDIFLEEGESGFRVLEQEACLAALATELGVVALGGGAPMTEEVARALDGHVVVFLDVGIADAARRVGFDRSRPLLTVNPRATWIAMMAERRPTYEALATHRVDTAGRAPEDIADEVVGLLEST